jgi:anti-sigma-K factor RskA
MKLASEKLIDHLASQYALGQLSPRTKRRFEAYASNRTDLRAAIAEWEERIGMFAASVPRVAPSERVWRNVEQQLFAHSTNAAAAKPAQTANKSVRTFVERCLAAIHALSQPVKLAGAAALGALVAFVLTNALVLRPKTEDIAALQREALPASYVGLLLDSKEVATLLASSLRHGKTLTIKMLKPLPKDTSVQHRLWAMPAEGAPFSLGLVPQSGSATIVMPDTSERLLSKVQRLVVFAEPVGTSKPSPTGTPVLSGNCVKLW